MELGFTVRLLILAVGGLLMGFWTVATRVLDRKVFGLERWISNLFLGFVAFSLLNQALRLPAFNQPAIFLVGIYTIAYFISFLLTRKFLARG